MDRKLICRCTFALLCIYLFIRWWLLLLIVTSLDILRSIIIIHFPSRVTSVRKHLPVRKTTFLHFNLFSRSVTVSNLKWLVRVAETYYWSIFAILRNEWSDLSQDAWDSLEFQYGKSAGKWASTRPPLLPIKSYAAVESELMKEIEKLQHDRPCPPSWPFAHRITFPLIDFFFSPLPRFSTLFHFVPISFFRRKK